MMKSGNIEAILSLYQKHGWNLRRVLLSDELRVRLTDRLQKLFGGTELVTSQLNAAWFSRLSKHGEAWELRNFGEPPFALVEVLPADADSETRNEVLTRTEARMLDKQTV